MRIVPELHTGTGGRGSTGSLGRGGVGSTETLKMEFNLIRNILIYVPSMKWVVCQCFSMRRIQALQYEANTSAWFRLCV